MQNLCAHASGWYKVCYTCDELLQYFTREGIRHSMECPPALFEKPKDKRVPMVAFITPQGVMIDGACAQNLYATRDFDISPLNGPFDDGARRSNVLEFAMELCSRPLILEQCPSPEDRRGWPDFAHATDPFLNMGPAACKRWAFLCQQSS